MQFGRSVKVAQAMKLLGISVSDKLLKAWSKILVYPVSPFFLNAEMRTRVSSLHLTRSEFSAIQDLSFHDSYATYEVGSEATWVALLSSAEFKNFSEEVRLELLQLQAQLGRGQLYGFDDYKVLLRKAELEQAQKYTFDFGGKMMLELSHTLWHSFSFETKKHWLEKFISEDRQGCLSSTLGKSEWQAISKHYPAVKHLVGFVSKSGANCFATTLAAMLGVGQAKSVSSLWLQRETFLRAVKEHGYQPSDREVNTALPGGSILLWQNHRGLQHACFHLGDGLVFNKDAQAWFAPRQILELESVLDAWQDFEVCAYVNRQQL
jgi:hypothetical protein